MNDEPGAQPGPFGLNAPPLAQGGAPLGPLSLGQAAAPAWCAPWALEWNSAAPAFMLAPPQLATVDVTPDELKLLAKGYKPLPAVVEAISSTAESFLWFHEINRHPLRLCHFLAQLAHESGHFTKLRESLYYSKAARIVEIFGPNHSANVTLEEAEKLVGKAEALAERVYGLGNPTKAAEFKHTVAGEGFKYRGRGLIQLTGKANYERFGKHADIKLDLVAKPELAEDPLIAVRLAVAFWKERGISALADADDVKGVTKRINGGTTGLADRKKLLATAKDIWLKKPLR